MPDALASELSQLLSNLTAAKDSVRAVAEWVKDESHMPYAIDIARALRKHALGLPAPLPSPSQPAVSDSPAASRFSKCLAVMYVVNDLLFHIQAGQAERQPAAAATADATAEPLTSLRFAFAVQLPVLIHGAARAAATSGATSESDAAKLTRTLGLWRSRGALEPPVCDALDAAAAAGFDTSGATPPPRAPPSPVLSVGRSTAASYSTKPAGDSVSTPLAGPSASAEASKLPSHLDLTAMPVGMMVGVLQLALAAGYPKYAAIDTRALPPARPPQIEPGRLQARLNDFLRKAAAMEAQAATRAAAAAAAPDAGDSDGERGRRSASRSRSRSRSRDRDRARHRDTYRDRERDKARNLDQDRDRDRDGDRDRERRGGGGRRGRFGKDYEQHAYEKTLERYMAVSGLTSIPGVPLPPSLAAATGTGAEGAAEGSAVAASGAFLGPAGAERAGLGWGGST